jgi:hypothetical protein
MRVKKKAGVFPAFFLVAEYMPLFHSNSPFLVAGIMAPGWP